MKSFNTQCILVDIKYVRMIVGELARDVVEDMSLRDTICSMGTDPTHDLATVTEEVTVESSKGTTREGELGSTVVRQNGVSVLKEGDQDKPVVNPTGESLEKLTKKGNTEHSPKVRNAIDGENLPDATVVSPGCEASKPERDTGIRPQDLQELVGFEHHRVGAEIYRYQTQLSIQILIG